MSEDERTYQSLTLDGLRQIIDELGQEPVQTNTDPIRDTNNTITVEGSSVTYTTVTNTDGTEYHAVPIDQIEVETDAEELELPDILDVPRRRRGTAKKKPLSEEAQRQLDQSYPINLARRRKREQPLLDLIIGPDDLVICFTMGGYVLLHNEMTKVDTLRNLLGFIGTTKDENFGIGAISKGFYFDKNGNILGLSTKGYQGVSKFQQDRYPAVPQPARGNEPYVYELPSVKRDIYLVIDKHKFIESRGKTFAIRYKEGVTYQGIITAKNRFIKEFERMMDFIETKKNIISGVYDEEMFDIIYYQNFRFAESRVHFLFRFNDLIIRNSIEQEHKIHTLITRIQGTHFRNTLSLDGNLEGVRLVFDPMDGKFQYSHSHLSRGGFRHFSGFCMGSDHFMTGSRGATGDIEFEALLYGMYDHVAWESLEGGPYIKMESVGNSMSRPAITGTPFNFPSYSVEANQQVLEHLRTLDLDALKSAFILGPNAKGEITYNVDSNHFYTTLCKLIGQEWIERFIADWDYAAYVFVPSKNSFAVKDEGMFNSADTWENLVKDARRRVNTIFPVYMNGEIIKPKLVEVEFEKDLSLTEELPSLHPGNMYVFLKYFQNKLLNGLRNEQR